MKRPAADNHAAYRDLDRVLEAARSAPAPVRVADAGMKRARAISLHGLVGDCVQAMRHLLGTGVALDFRAERDSVEGDPAELEQALLDVCLCACDCTVEGGKLTLSTDNVVLVYPAALADPPNTTWVRLVVSDSSPGADEPGQARGLDVDVLPQARVIVARYGGTLEVRSAPPWGTTVCLCLPCTAAQ
jgi:signal transduction histidine kinase